MPEPGAHGYSDYQRVANWDGPLSVNINAAKHNAEFATETFFTGRYQSLLLNGGVGKAPISMEIQWFADAARTIFLGRRFMWLSPSIPNALQANIRNLGPWCWIIFRPEKAGAEYELTLRAIQSNRILPVEVPSTLPSLLEVIAFGIGAKTEFLFPFNYFGGAAYIHCAVVGPACLIALQAQGSNGTFIHIWEQEVGGAAPKNANAVVQLPLGTWLCAITNEVAEAATVNVSVLPGVTGSN